MQDTCVTRHPNHHRNWQSMNALSHAEEQADISFRSRVAEVLRERGHEAPLLPKEIDTLAVRGGGVLLETPDRRAAVAFLASDSCLC
jgi:hypothetical protein